MGHGNKKLIDMYREKAKVAQEEFVEWEESICNAVANYEQALYKDTGKIILDNEDFFTSLSDIDRVSNFCKVSSLLSISTYWL